MNEHRLRWSWMKLMIVASTVVALMSTVIALMLWLQADPSPPSKSLDSGGTAWSSIADLVSDMDAIVIAEVSGVMSESTETDPGPPGGTPTGFPTLPPEYVEVPIPVTDFAATSHESLHHDGALPTGQTFALRILGHPSDVSGTEISPYPSSGHQYLMFLMREDINRYGLLFNGMFIVDGSTVTWPDGSPFELAQGMSSTEFIQAVRDEIETQYGL